MSLQRCSTSLRYSANSLSRIASLLNANAPPSRSPSHTSLCIRCYAHTLPPRRPLSTATEYKPYTLDPSPPPPPRNTDIPDTSIAGPKPTINDTRPPDLPEQATLSPSSFPSPSSSLRDQPETASLSLPESEAQKSKPVTPTPPPPTPKRTSKLRPRKAAMVLTPGATVQLRSLLDSPEPKYIRVGVKNRGCSGLAYHLEYVDKPGKFDETVEQDGVTVLVDSKALFSIIGSEMDWVEDKLEQRFVFRNPNIKEQCGCGESFMV